MRDPNKSIQTVNLDISPMTSLLFQTLTVADLARQIERDGHLVAVEKNGEAVPESQFAGTRLHPGDRYAFIIATEGRDRIR